MIKFLPTSTSDSTEEKERLFDLLLEQNDGLPLRVARGSLKTGLPVQWSTIHKYEPYDLRVVLPNEVVFDVGDNLGKERFDLVAEQTNYLWDFLTSWDVPFWGALSGGKGTHTHVFLAPPRMRGEFVKAVQGRMVDEFGEDADIDLGHLTPTGDLLIREFGARKYDIKRLVCSGPEEAARIPSNRTEAYEQAHPRLPVDLRIAVEPIGVRHKLIREALSGYCPKSSACFDVEKTYLDGFCGSCPAHM